MEESFELGPLHFVKINWLSGKAWHILWFCIKGFHVYFNCSKNRHTQISHDLPDFCYSLSLVCVCVFCEYMFWTSMFDYMLYSLPAGVLFFPFFTCIWRYRIINIAQDCSRQLRNRTNICNKTIFFHVMPLQNDGPPLKPCKMGCCLSLLHMLLKV